MTTGDRSCHWPLEWPGAQERGLTSRTEEEEGREAFCDLEQAMESETGATTHSQADSLVRVNPSLDSDEQAKKGAYSVN